MKAWIIFTSQKPNIFICPVFDEIPCIIYHITTHNINSFFFHPEISFRYFITQTKRRKEACLMIKAIHLRTKYSIFKSVLTWRNQISKISDIEDKKQKSGKEDNNSRFCQKYIYWQNESECENSCMISRP